VDLVRGGGCCAGHTASIQQTVTIPSGNTPVTASWWVWVGALGGGDESLTVTFDGVTKATYTTADAGVYMHVSIDVSAAADGGTHTLRFAYANPVGNDANMNIDDVSIFNSPVPAVPTGLAVTPPRARTTTTEDQGHRGREHGDGPALHRRDVLDDDRAATDAGTFNGAGIPVSVADNSSTDFYAKATGPGGTSGCSASTVHYDEVTPPAPVAPTGLMVSPRRARTTTLLHQRHDRCEHDDGPALHRQLLHDVDWDLGRGGDVQLAGIQVSVADNSSTDFYAIASGRAGIHPVRRRRSTTTR